VHRAGARVCLSCAWIGAHDRQSFLTESAFLKCPSHRQRIVYYHDGEPGHFRQRLTLPRRASASGKRVVTMEVLLRKPAVHRIAPFVALAVMVLVVCEGESPSNSTCIAKRPITIENFSLDTVRVIFMDTLYYDNGRRYTCTSGPTRVLDSIYVLPSRTVTETLSYYWSAMHFTYGSTSVCATDRMTAFSWYYRGSKFVGGMTFGIECVSCVREALYVPDNNSYIETYLCADTVLTIK
jgi:hypothetical protein